MTAVNLLSLKLKFDHLQIKKKIPVSLKLSNFDKDIQFYFIHLYFRKESSKKNISKTPFVAPGPTKEQCSPGDHYGTFGGKVEGK
jgi:hypothetical protein